MSASCILGRVLRVVDQSLSSLVLSRAFGTRMPHVLSMYIRVRVCVCMYACMHARMYACANMYNGPGCVEKAWCKGGHGVSGSPLFCQKSLTYQQKCRIFLSHEPCTYRIHVRTHSCCSQSAILSTGPHMSAREPSCLAYRPYMYGVHVLMMRIHLLLGLLFCQRSLIFQQRCLLLCYIRPISFVSMCSRCAFVSGLARYSVKSAVILAKVPCIPSKSAFLFCLVLSALYIVCKCSQFSCTSRSALHSVKQAYILSRTGMYSVKKPVYSVTGALHSILSMC